MVPMPKASMNEDCQAATPVYNIGLPRQLCCVQSETQSQAAQYFSDRKFWRSILSADPRH
jgi:hypothetical protein